MTSDSDASLPLATAILAMYNVADYLLECLDSLAAQDLDEPFEVIIIDD